MPPRRGVGQSSPLQRRTLYALVRADQDLCSAKFRADFFTHQDAQERWERVAFRVNRLPGVRKNWRQWRKAWQDYKTMRSKRHRNTDNIKLEDSSQEEGTLNPIEELDIAKPSPDDFDEESDGNCDSSYEPLKRPSKKDADSVSADSSLEGRLKFVMERELTVKSSYYERKMVLMERQVVALERIADIGAKLGST